MVRRGKEKWSGGEGTATREGGEHLWIVGKKRKDIVDEGICNAPGGAAAAARDVHCSWKQSLSGGGGGSEASLESRDVPLGDVGLVGSTSVTSLAATCWLLGYL